MALLQQLMRLTKTIIKVILSILFLTCLIEMPYGYIQLFRFLGMVVFAILAYNNYQNKQTWFVIWLASAILINPLFKISHGRNIWNIVDIT